MRPITVAEGAIIEGPAQNMNEVETIADLSEEDEDSKSWLEGLGSVSIEHEDQHPSCEPFEQGVSNADTEWAAP